MSQRGVLVFGGRGRIGSAIVREFATRNVPVAVADLTSEENLSRQGFLSLKVDATDENQMDELCERISSNFDIGAVINSTYPSMITARSSVNSVSVSNFLADVDMHLSCGFLISKFFGAHLAGKGGGSIVHLSSIYGSKVPRFEIYESEEFSMPIAYAVAKSGLQMMSNYFAELFKKNGVRFNCVSPGGVLDGHNPEFRHRYGRYSASSDLLTAEKVAAAVAFLASPESAAVTGQNLTVDEGWTL